MTDVSRFLFDLFHDCVKKLDSDDLIPTVDLTDVFKEGYHV